MPRLYAGDPDFAFSLVDRLDVNALMNRPQPTRVTIDVAMLDPATGRPGSRATISAILPPGASELEVRRHLYATLRAYIAENAIPEPNEPQSRIKRRNLDRREGETLSYQSTDYEPTYDEEIFDEDDGGEGGEPYGPTVIYAIRY